tara:strand:- start:761 stop:1468 length:708 start_codon:yes stop_codon:yes gene_type:complete
MKYTQLLSINADTKTSKGKKYGYLTGILYLAPHKISGRNFCPNASKGCAEACLYSAGRGKFTNVQQARINKSRYFIENRHEFMLNLINSIEKLIRKSERENLIPVVRLNGTSDIAWENIKINPYRLNIFELFPAVQFYDYTKSYKRMINTGIKNYHLTFSRSESNDYEVRILNHYEPNVNIAIVFDKLPSTYLGRKVINGDLSDLRFKDDKSVIVGLLAKGDAKKDFSNFVIRGA